MINACYLTNIGKERTNNEDSLLIHEVLICQTTMLEPRMITCNVKPVIFVVADGMGGHMKGELASRKTLEVFRDNFNDITSADQIGNLLNNAQSALNSIASDDASSKNMGTTVAGIVVKSDSAIVFNCGDSRVYRLNGQYLEKITRDHSIVQNLADIGEITEDQMRTHPRKNVLTASIMGDLKNDAPEYYAKKISFREGQRFFLCTDGVWDCMSIEEMEACFAHENLKDVVQELYKKIMDSDADDNFSIIVLEGGNDEQS